MRRLRLAVPNKGRLMEPTADLLRDAGLAFERTDRSLTVPVRNVPIDLLFVRTEDVVEMVDDGVAEMGIAGLDLLVESGTGLRVAAELAYGRCRLSAAVPKASDIEKLEDLDGLRVATAHPRATRSLLAERTIEVDIVPLRGSVEVAPKLGVADAVVDLVSSGSTMLVNGLRPIATLLTSQAVLIAGADVNGDIDQVATMLGAVVAGRRRRYVMMNAPADAARRIGDLIPGLDAPTVIPLADTGLVAIHSVVDTDELWNLLPELESAGASGILVLPIEQLIP
ncbi:MAG: ATP phosphoribosyltransferase [Acidimicrobiia bacterium]|nr:ATP phosphoribosyltransferase [Acidimicrobiia bacterium]